MLINEFPKDYFRSSFFWSGLSLFILTIFYANPTANQILQSLIIDRAYLSIFIALLTAAIIIAGYPIRRGLMEFYKKHDKKTRLLFGSLILLTFLIYVPYFAIDNEMILTTLWHSVITDPVQFEFAKNVTFFVEFAGLPMAQFYNFHIIKSRFRKEGYKIDDSLRNNLKSVFYAFGVCATMMIVSYFVTGIHLA